MKKDSIIIPTELLFMIKKLADDDIEGLFKIRYIKEFAKYLEVDYALKFDEVLDYMTRIDIENSITMLYSARKIVHAMINIYDEYIITLDKEEKCIRLLLVEKVLPNPPLLIDEWETEVDIELIIQEIIKYKKRRN